jgi:hypothetical protein
MASVAGIIIAAPMPSTIASPKRSWGIDWASEAMSEPTPKTLPGVREPESPDAMTDEREETLGEFLAERARRATGDHLAWQAVTAVLAAVAIIAWRGPAWDLRLAIAVALLSFGMWGVADRDLEQVESRPRTRLVVRAVRLTAAIAGFAAAAYLMMALLARALGRIIS